MKLNTQNEYNAKYLAMLPMWKCFKIVQAGKISFMAKDEPNGKLMIHAEPSNMPFEVPLDFLHRHSPEIGGYFVVYGDGYISYSPAATFQAGYRNIELSGKENALDPVVVRELRDTEMVALDNSFTVKIGGIAFELAEPVHAFTQKGGTALAMANLTGHSSGTEDAAPSSDFSFALRMLKAGERVCRAGWNGKGQYVRTLVPQAPHPDDSPEAVPSNPYFKMWDNNPQAEGTFTTFLILKNAQNKVFPWLPSMGDLMADDWQVCAEPLETDMPPHQLRVLEELAEIAGRLDKLTAFFDTETYRSLDVNERHRLKEQSLAMGEYQRVLIERVAAFS